MCGDVETTACCIIYLPSDFTTPHDQRKNSQHTAKMTGSDSLIDIMPIVIISLLRRMIS
jgi:hypothetical protein